MNLSSIRAGDSAWPTTTASARTRSAPDAETAGRPGDDEQAIADGLSSLDGALEKGDIEKARKALSRVRSNAGLQEDGPLDAADPLSGLASALKAEDLGAAREAWDDFRSALGDEPPEDYSLTVTRTATFSILA